MVVPFYKSAAENFDVTPAQLAVDVNAATSALAFTVFGFSAHGRVIDRNGAGIAGAKVLVDGRQSAVTDSKGVYRLEGVAAGSYTIEVTKEHHGFQTLKNVELSAAHVNVPEIVVLRFAVCGTVEAVENKQGRTVTLVGERRRRPPYGLAGGGPGSVGEDLLERGTRIVRLPAKCTFEAEAGDRLTLRTPGGGSSRQFVLVAEGGMIRTRPLSPREAARLIRSRAGAS